jgi:hypothetical protein
MLLCFLPSQDKLKKTVIVGMLLWLNGMAREYVFKKRSWVCSPARQTLLIGCLNGVTVYEQDKKQKI